MLAYGVKQNVSLMLLGIYKSCNYIDLRGIFLKKKVRKTIVMKFTVITDNCDVCIVSDDIQNRAHKDMLLPSVTVLFLSKDQTLSTRSL